MSGGITKRGGAGLILIVALALLGCSGGNSTTGGGETVLVPQTYAEQCTLCHRAGSIAGVAAVHSKDDGSPVGEIARVTIDGAAGTVRIFFSIYDNATGSGLVPLAGVPANDIRFTLAKLVAVGVTPSMGTRYAWQSYINTTETKEVGDPGTAPDGNTTVQATAERASANTAVGAFVDNGDGSYEYQLSININTVTTPISVPYEPTLTHRVAMQIADNDENAVFDFLPLSGATPVADTRNIVANQACNECHIQLGFHGGGRIQTGYCVTCHNPGTTDANSNNTVDFKVMIHKIHAGASLPEVQAGGEYAIWGFGNNKHDYSTVVFPQDLNNCTKCHDNSNMDTPDADNWMMAPSTEACTTCHDAPDATEYPTFPDLTPAEITAVHLNQSEIAAGMFEYNIIGITGTTPGEFPAVTFSVTDPSNSDAPYNILTDPEFTAAGGASRLAVLIGWSTTDYTNTGSASTPAQPVSINPLSAGVATDNGDGTFTVTSPVALPATVTGSGVVAIEGHPAADLDGDGTYSDRVPVTGVTQAFPVTDSAAVSRRAAVDIDNCNQCHGRLSLHGNNRTNNIQLCVICHNANATDIEVRPPAAQALDGKVEEAIDFKYMIHAIHSGQADMHGFREEGIVVYGFGGSVHDFSEVALPSGIENLRNCTGCHTGSSFEVPISTDALETTVSTGANLASPDDDTNRTPTAAVCSSCHDELSARTHMAEQGGLFDWVPFAPESAGDGDGSEVDLCGPGPISAQPAGHTARTDCCSCHGFQ